MSVTITITDPTVQEANALRTYLDALHGSAGKWHSGYTSTEQHDKEMMEELHAAILDPKTYPISEETIVSAEDAGAPDFDSSGLPWDERIHASSRATISDGTWKKKRGVSPEEVAAVEAELRAAIEEHAPIVGTVQGVIDQEVPEVPAPEPVGTATEAAGSMATETSAPVAAEPPAPEVPSPVPAPPVDTPNPFLAVMSRIGKSKLDKAKKDELLTAAGALDEKGNPSILVLNKKPELIAGFVALLDDAGV